MWHLWERKIGPDKLRRPTLAVGEPVFGVSPTRPYRPGTGYLEQLRGLRLPVRRQPGVAGVLLDSES